ncbi:hypothetical protein HU200_038772 [Digitaria exilis]|uniref:Disease resistance R13L4/SHOC-2-like LRR domain-containing protein n=1 Tax=Digitaria exilis TaxID=1010633 RepID=A0A835BN15_9POAL|nr:hypothetical protein HU200_038772 [Digitaria exilis]
MADHGKETITPPPPSPSPETETMDGAQSATETTDYASEFTSEAATETTVSATPPPPPPPPPPPREVDPTDDDVASELDDSTLSTEDESDVPDLPAPPQEKPEATAAAGQPQQTATEATTTQPPPLPTKAEEEPVVTTPPSSETPPPPPPPPQGMVAEKVDAAEKQLPETPPAPPLQPPPAQQQQQQEGGPTEEASSVHEEEKNKTPVMAQEQGEETKLEGEKKKKQQAAGPSGVHEARRRWRQLQAAVRLIFCKKRDRSTPQPHPESPLPEGEGEGQTKLHEGDMKPAAPAGNQPASGEEQTAPVPPPPETPSSQETPATTADAEKPLPTAPPTQQQPPQKQEGIRHPEQASTVQEEEKDAAAAQEGGEKAARRWRWLRAAVRLLFLRPKHKEVSGVAEGKKTTTPAEEELAQRKDSEEKEEKPKPKPKPHPKWRREEERLEKILEDAFTRLLATEYHQLRPIRRKCLLTFSVFELADEVKKQAMVYWWVSEFNLKHQIDQSAATDAAAAPAEMRSRKRKLFLGWERKPAAAPAAGGSNNSPAPQRKDGGDSGGSNPPDDEAAEGIFSELSSNGFLEPKRNWCSKVIHGCKVNPLVHWMVKRRARDDGFADLDVDGKPAKLQRGSSIACLTAANRHLLQEMRMKDDEPQLQHAANKPNTTRTTSPTSLQSTTQDKAPGQVADKHNTTRTTSRTTQDQDKAPDQGKKNTQTILDYEHEDISPSFKRKRVILNVNAHVYPVSKSMFLYLADYLVVLQLGRWCNLDDKTYMEVDGLESLSEIGLLRNLRYLSLRGLRLTQLPKGIQQLKKLAILDMRGCQNLVNVKITMPLKQLTHLDLTECYMLEHIGRGITSLSELQVFKGFVFATGTQGNRACRVQDLKKLKKLQKLTISIATEANVGKGDMAELKHLTSLHKLTITWSEIPRILDGDSENVKSMREGLVEKWTSFDVPQELLKLDLRCYPKKELKLKVHPNLKKLYLRGGDLEKFSIDEPQPINSSDKTNCITTLRLRYLKNFNMDWEEIRSVLKDIEYVEIVLKDEKVTKDVDKDQKDNNMNIKDQKVDVDKDEKDKNIDMKDQDDKHTYRKDQKDIGEAHKLMNNIDMKDQKDIDAEQKFLLKKRMLYSNLDESGVWVKDSTEEANLLRLKALGDVEKSKGALS